MRLLCKQQLLSTQYKLMSTHTVQQQVDMHKSFEDESDGL